MLGPRGPHLLAVDDVAVAAPLGEGADRRRVGAGGGLGDAEGLEAERAGRDLRQVLPLLRRAAVAQHGAHHVHLGMAGAAVAAGLVDLLENGRGGADAEPAAAILL